MTLKDIVELSVAPLHSLQSVAYLGQKTSEHRHRLWNHRSFPSAELDTQTPFFWSTNLALIKAFVPLVGLWTMCFEAKHRFFKTCCEVLKQFQKCFAVSFNKTSAVDGLQLAKKYG